MRSSFDDLFLPEPNSGCWIWIGGLYQSGYGSFKVDRASKRAHRFSWELHNGTIPTGMVVCHKCDTPSCVNPDHLFIGSQRDNIADMIRKDRRRPDVFGKQVTVKLSANDVMQIRSSPEIGFRIAKKFGVSKTTIYKIRKNETWRQI
jgi:hypothetical protein